MQRPILQVWHYRWNFKPSTAPKSPNGSLTVVLSSRIHRGIDGHNEPCSFYWSDTVDAWGSGGLVLLRHDAEDQLERVNLPSEPWRVHDPTEPRVARGTQCLFELNPGESTWFFAGIPDSWLETMVSGGNYELLWPGGEIHWWAWGSIEENEGKLHGDIPRAVLSGTPHVSFTVIDEPPPPIYKTPLPRWTKDPAAGTPLLAVTLTGADKKELLDTNFHLLQTVTYQGLVSKDPNDDPEPSTKPIIFDAFQLMVPIEWAFRSSENGKWEYCPGQSIGCAMTDLMYDGETVVNVGKERRWISLSPGESWSQELDIDEQLPPDLTPGDKVRYQLDSRVIEMWNWGSKEDHAETVLKLPSNHEAGDWMGRPPIVVPASNPLEFTIVH